jgi:NADP-dependent 3-hydroxy acid dehydrogenase YdfG
MPMNTPIADWRGRHVWIVGGSTGIGAALAQRLHADGASLALSARSAEKLEAVAAACGDAIALPLDVRDAGAVAAAAQRLVREWQGIDLAVFNAGSYTPVRAWELDPDSARQMIDTNLMGVINGVAAVLPSMLARGQGAIAVVASVAGYHGLPNALVYGATKAALINFCETLHLDLAPRGVDVFLINPGFVETPLTAQNRFRMPALISADEAARLIVEGLEAGRFEIHFPKRFTRWLKLLALLPYGLSFRAIRRLTES